MSSDQQNPIITQQIPKPPAKAMWICIIIAWVLLILPIPGTVFIGSPVNLAAIILAILCIARGSVGTGIIGLICTTVVSAVVYLIGLALTAGGLAVLSAPH